MDNNPQISIIIPNLNSPIIDKVITSLLNQKSYEKKIEIIIVGQDKYNLIPNHDKVNFIDTKKVTAPSLARNIGVEMSKGELILFLDADCIASPDLLFQHIRGHQIHENSIIGGSVSFPNNNYWTLCDNISTFHEYLSYLPSTRKQILPSLNLSIKKAHWLEIGGFDTNFLHAAGEDAEFAFRAGKLSINIIFFPAAVVEHLPNRVTFNSILKHAYNFGKYSIKIDPRNKKGFNSIFFKNGLLLRFFSPFFAFAIINKMIFIEKLPLKYWFTIPFVFLTKITWCFGAAEGINRNRSYE